MKSIQTTIRLAGADVPNKKCIGISLRYIYGIGPTYAAKICATLNIEPTTRTYTLTEAQKNAISDLIEKQYIVGHFLKRDIRQNIERKIHSGSYAGIRHRSGMPVNGQRTKTNAKTARKLLKKTMGGNNK